MDDTTTLAPGRLSAKLIDRLRELEATISPGQIADLWVFPPLPEVENSAEFFLLSCFQEGGRRLYSARLRRNGAGTPNGNGRPEETTGRGTGQEVVEHGAVPADRIPGMIERFRRRLGEEREPVHVSIAGRETRWAEIVGPESASGSESDGLPR